MSSIKLTADSGGGTFEIKAPSSSANTRVLTLPDTGNITLGGPYGKILQVVSTTKTDTFSTTSTSFTDITGFSVNITPSSSSNKVLVTGLVTFGGSDGEAYGYTFNLARVIGGSETDICIADAASNRTRATLGTQGFNNGDATMGHSLNFLDSPSTTSQVTYKVRARAENPKTLYVNRGNEADGDQSITSRFVSTITVMEVAA